MSFGTLKPRLICSEMEKAVDKVAKIAIKSGGALTVSEKIIKGVNNIWNEYIVDNAFFVVITLIIIGFFVYRYYDKKEKQLKSRISEGYIDNERINNSIKSHATLNRLYSIKTQNQYTSENINPEYLNSRDIYTNSQQFEPQYNELPIQNPLGFPSNFNQTTDNYIQQNNQLNRNILNQYETNQNIENNNLIDGLSNGTEYALFNDAFPEMDLPYAD